MAPEPEESPADRIAKMNWEQIIESEPDFKHDAAFDIFDATLTAQDESLWSDCRSVTVRRRGRTLCRFYEPQRDSSAPDGWWRLRCDPMSAKQLRALRQMVDQPVTLANPWYRTAANYVKNPLVWRHRLDAQGNVIHSTPFVMHYDLQPGDTEVIVFPKPLGRVPATVLHPVLTKFADYSIPAVELDTLTEAVNRNK